MGVGVTVGIGAIVGVEVGAGVAVASGVGVVVSAGPQLRRGSKIRAQRAENKTTSPGFIFILPLVYLFKPLLSLVSRPEMNGLRCRW